MHKHHRNRARVVALEHGQQDEKSGSRKSSLLDEIADASWDMFVMPGEAANSIYDRPIGTLNSTTPQDNNSTSKSTFAWGASDDAESLRLPQGVKAAERLSVPVSRPRRLWFEIEGRGISGDMKALSDTWTAGWALGALLVLAAVAQLDGFAPAASPLQTLDDGNTIVDRREELRQRQETFMRERLREKVQSGSQN